MRAWERGIADATRLFTMSLSELLDRWFESEQMKTIMMVDGLIGQWSGPDEPGTAYVLLHHAIGDVGRRQPHRELGVPAGWHGLGRRPIRNSAASFGAEIRTEVLADASWARVAGPSASPWTRARSCAAPAW